MLAKTPLSLFTLVFTLVFTVIYLPGCGESLGPVWQAEDAPTTYSEFDGELYPGPCSIEWDFGLDGTVNFRKTYTYDGEGTLLFEEWDRHADGSIDSRRSYFYDAQGALITSEWDKDANGTVDTTTVDTTDQAMNPIDETAMANGTRDYAFDENGNVRLEEYDPENDGIVNARAIYSYDETGNLATKEWDDGADGSVEWRGHYVYDCWQPRRD